MSRRLLIISLLCLVAMPALGWTPEELWQDWPGARFMSIAAPCLRHDELLEALRRLEARYSERIRLEEVGTSFLGRPIEMLTLGDGDQTILLWSQMHGDEPSATPALLDIAAYLLAHEEDPSSRAILDRFTLLMIPMLNPDGSELYERRNAQAIDINRDALNLATPEGRTLKRIRDRYEPILGFNLHDQNRRTAVGDTGVLATNAVLAVAGDPEGTVTPGRLRAKRACSAIVEALAPFVPGGTARYDEDWSPRAFGDNLTAWGTPVVLIESGGPPPGRDLTDLTRLNFVAILAVLQDLAKDDLAGYDPEIYENLTRNQSDSWAEVVVRGGYLLQPGDPEPYRADLAFYLFRDDRQMAGCASEERVASGIFEIGDARFIGAGHEVEAGGSTLVSPFVVGVRKWSARKWLDGELLSDLARMGVGSVRWVVPQRRQVAAEAFAGRLNRPGRAALVVVDGSAIPDVVWGPPPNTADTDTLAAILRALGAIEHEGDLEPDAVVRALQRLWADDLSVSSALPVIRRGRPASFLVLSPAPEGRFDWQHTRLQAVWLDGVEIEAGR